MEYLLMLYRRLFTLAFVPIFLLTFSARLADPPPSDDYSEIAKEVFEIVNTYRKSKGLRALRPKVRLNEIAYAHSLDMSKERVPFSHTGFDNRVRLVREYAHVPYRVAENLYAIEADRNIARYALKGWIDSPGHKVNMEGDWLFTGVGVSRSKSGEYFVTQIFVGKQ
jgi:uncharacterized protein YkwD